MTKKEIICHHCKKETATWCDEFCQECWEAHCDRTWAEEVVKVQELSEYLDD